MYPSLLLSFYMVFKSGNPSAADAEYIEEPIPKGFGFSIFTGLVFPFIAKDSGPAFYFIPT